MHVRFQRFQFQENRIQTKPERALEAKQENNKLYDSIILEKKLYQQLIETIYMK